MYVCIYVCVCVYVCVYVCIGEDLAAWQLKQYTQWKSVEAEKTAFEEQLRLEEWGEYVVKICSKDM